MSKIKNEFLKIFNNKLIFLVGVTIVFLPFLISFISFFTKNTFLNFWDSSYYIVECKTNDDFLKQIENSKKTIDELNIQFLEGFITHAQLENGIILANKRISIYEYMMNNNISFASCAPIDGLFYSNNPDNSLYFINYYFSSVTMFSTIIVILFGSLILNTQEFDIKVTKYIYQGSLKNRVSVQQNKFFVVFILALSVFIFDSLLLIVFSSVFDNSVETILVIHNDYSIKAISSSILILYIIISNIFELAFYLLIIFALSKLIPSMLITIIVQLLFIFSFIDLPFRINNHYFSLLTKPFFALLTDSFSTGEIIINVVFKLVLSLTLFTLSSLYFKKREI